MYVTIINLTSHDVAIKTDYGYEVFPAPPRGPNGEWMHAQVEYGPPHAVRTDEGITIRLKRERTVRNLPEIGYRDHKCDVKTLYVVNREVADACPERTDLVCLERRVDNFRHTIGQYDELYAPNEEAL